jgi:TRAP-type C4-dicarboxylate transport system permease small subunit
MVAAAAVVTTSVVLRWLASDGIRGDFDLVQFAVPLAVFAFLPLCQLRGGNIFVDTFTMRLPARWQAALDAFWALVYAAVAALIAWRMAIGAKDAIASGTGSMVLGLPVGWAMAASALLAAWLALVAIVTVRSRRA